MLIQIILLPIWFLISALVSLLPKPALEVTINSSFFDVLSKGVSIIGLHNFMMVIGSVAFWFSLQMGWSIIEWVYKKIPGVN